jgi:hypothetical protein
MLLPFITLPTEELIAVDESNLMPQSEYSPSLSLFNLEEDEEEEEENDNKTNPTVKFSPWAKPITTPNLPLHSQTTSKLDVKSTESLLHFLETYRSEYKLKPSHSLTKNIGMFDKLAVDLGMLTKDTVMNMKKSDYMNYNLNIKILIGKCKIPILNLREAGIVTQFDDLIDLKFQLRDLAISRKRFSVNHLQQNYGMGYSSLIRHDRFDFSINALIKAQLTEWDLKSLEFSFDDFIEKVGMTKHHFLQLPYDLEQLNTLGLTSVGIKELDITTNDAQKLGWPIHQFKEIRDS